MKRTAPTLPKNIVGETIKKLRKAKKGPTVSQQDLSGRLAALGVTIDRSAIARIEHGERYVLDYEAVAIARALRVPLDCLFGRK